MSNKKFNRGSIGTMGYYIALVLCAFAIGISGYLYYQNANEEKPQLQNPTEGVKPGSQQDIPVGGTEDPNATQPSGTQSQSGLTGPVQTCLPVQGETVTPYAMDVLCYNETTRDWRTHNGLDIAAAEGTKVCAAADGIVYTVYEDELMGYTVVIRHDGGYTTRYSSLAEEPSVEPGQEVKMGDAIGCVGTTALMESALECHVHFSVTCYDESIDPMEFLNMD